MTDSYGQVPQVGVHSNQEVTPQAAVSTKINMSPNIIEERTRSIYGLPDGEFVPGAINATTLAVRNQELIFIQKDNQRAGLTNTAARVEGFSAFNGLVIPPKIKHHREFTRLFKFVGVATGTLDFVKDIPNKNGVAVQIAGSKTINNSSNTTFSPGDTVGFVAPFMNENDRARQYRSILSRKRADHGIEGKFSATLEKISYENITNVMNAISTFLVENNKNIPIPDYRMSVVKGMDSNHNPDLDRAAWLKQLLLLNSYQTLVAAQNHNLIFIDDYVDAGATGISTEALIDIERDRRSLRRVSDLTTETKSPEELAKNRTNRDVFAHHIACTLGLTFHPERKISEDVGLTNDILVGTLFSNLDPKLFNGGLFDRKDLLSEFRHTPGQLVSSLGQPTIYANIPKQIMQIQNTASDMFAKVYAESISEIYDGAIGHSSNVSIPNGPLHLCM